MFVDPVSPSTDWESYDNDTSGAGPAAAGGTRMGYDHEKSPVCADTCHADDGFNGVAANDPAPDADTGADVAANSIGDADTSGVATRDFVLESRAVATGVSAVVVADVFRAIVADESGNCTHLRRPA
ncbi:hypothetical protein [Humibacter ginsengiterrae]